jgi:hypothetical protein
MAADLCTHVSEQSPRLQENYECTIVEKIVSHPHYIVLPDFCWYNIPKRVKIYQRTLKHTKWLQNIPNSHKIDQMDI